MIPNPKFSDQYEVTIAVIAPNDAAKIPLRVHDRTHPLPVKSLMAEDARKTNGAWRRIMVPIA